MLGGPEVCSMFLLITGLDMKTDTATSTMTEDTKIAITVATTVVAIEAIIIVTVIVDITTTTHQEDMVVIAMGHLDGVNTEGDVHSDKVIMMIPTMTKNIPFMWC